MQVLEGAYLKIMLCEPMVLTDDAVWGALSFSADGRWLATTTSGARVQLWDARQWTLARTFSARARPDAIALAPDGNTVACVRMSSVQDRWSSEHYEWAVEIRNVEDEQVLRSLPMGDLGNGMIRSLAFSPDSSTVACGSWRGEDGQLLRVWDASSGDLKWELREPTLEFGSLSFSHDCSMLAVGSPNWHYHGPQARVVEAETGRLIRAFLTQQELRWEAHLKLSASSSAWQDRATLHPDRPSGFSIVPDGHNVAFVSGGRLLTSTSSSSQVVWDVSLEKPLFALPDYGHFVAVSHDGRLVATCSDSMTAESILVTTVRDLDTQAILCQLRRPKRSAGESAALGGICAASTAAFSADASVLAKAAAVAGRGCGVRGCAIEIWPLPKQGPPQAAST